MKDFQVTFPKEWPDYPTPMENAAVCAILCGQG